MHLPLRLRLTMVFGVAMAVVLVGFGSYSYQRLTADFLSSVDAGLRARAQVLANSITHDLAGGNVQGEGRLIDPDEAIAQVLDGAGTILDASTAVADDPLLSPDEARTLAAPLFLSRMIESADQDDPYRLLAVPLDLPIRRIIVVGSTLSDVNQAQQRFLDLMRTTGPLVILFVSAAGWLLAGAALAPVEAMRQEAAAVSALEPQRRLSVPQTGDELARLATTLNGMLDRLQEAIERERHFVDTASHELRTPLATLRTEIDLALMRDRTPQELEAALRSAQEDVHRLHRLTEDLLVQARLRGGRLPVRRRATRLSTLVANVLQIVGGQADRAGLRMVTEAPEDEVMVDPDRIEQALRDLVENAIRHTPPGGEIRVSAQPGDAGPRFVVSDTGSGFDADVLAALRDPKAKRPPTASLGLGLSIVRAVAEAHGGTVVLENAGQGARVTMNLRS